MKETRKGILLMLVLMLFVVGTYLVTGTYAKYTTEVTGTSETTIAGWAWEINEEALTKDSTTYELNLFETIKDSNTTDSEANVKAGLIAPGTSGQFEIKVKNNSEVDATYAYNFNVTNGLGANIQWSDNNSEWTDNIADLNVSASLLKIGSETATKTIYWKWAFEEGANAEEIAVQDAKDTEVGFNAATATNANNKKIIVTATLNLVQVD